MNIKTKLVALATLVLIIFGCQSQTVTPKLVSPETQVKAWVSKNFHTDTTGSRVEFNRSQFPTEILQAIASPGWEAYGESNETSYVEKHLRLVQKNIETSTLIEWSGFNSKQSFIPEWGEKGLFVDVSVFHFRWESPCTTLQEYGSTVRVILVPSRNQKLID